MCDSVMSTPFLQSLNEQMNEWCVPLACLLFLFSTWIWLSLFPPPPPPQLLFFPNRAAKGTIMNGACVFILDFSFSLPFFFSYSFFLIFLLPLKKKRGGGLKFIFWPLDQLSCQLLKTASLNLLAFNPQIYLISLFSLVCLFRGFSDTFMYPLSQSSSMCSFCTI